MAGYHYSTDKNGKKHRVYDKKARAPARRIPRPMHRAVSGQGGYYDSRFVKTMKRIIPKGSFAAGGSLVGGPLGAFAGNVLSKVAGFGEYTVSKNSLLIDEGQSPAVMHSSNTTTRIKHREYITDIVSSSAANTFNLQAFAINPGLWQTFPWLAEIALQFQEWIPHGIMFEFKSLSADAIASSTNNTLGGVIMSTNYNAASANFANKQAMDNTQYTTSCKPSMSNYHPVECARGMNVLNDFYVRNLAVPTNQDQKTYDLGNFQIASFGVQGTSVVLGELWVTYDIELRKPISTAAQGLDVLADHFRLAGTLNNTHPLGSASVLAAGSTLGGTITVGGVTYFFNPLIQEGNFLVNYNVLGTAAAITSPLLTLTNCSIIAMYANDTSSSIAYPENAVTAGHFQITFVVSVSGPSAAITFGVAGSLPTAITSGDLVVTQIASSIIT